ncbi:cysteine hydrolase [soil metagenome]
MSLTVSQTTPYSWPYDGQIDQATLAVLLISPTDVPSGLGVSSMEWDSALRVVDSVRNAGGMVINVMTVPPAPQGPTQASPVSSVAVDATTVSQGIDGFYGSALDAVLRRHSKTHLVLVGLGLETCIHSTMRSANDRGLECLLVLDACVAYESGMVASARSQIEMSGGIFGAVGTTDHVCAAVASLPATTAERAFT